MKFNFQATEVGSLGARKIDGQTCMEKVMLVHEIAYDEEVHIQLKQCLIFRYSI